MKQASGAALAHLSTDALAVLESIGDAFYALDRDWRFIYANRRALAFWNLPAEEVLGRVIWERFPQILGSPTELALRQARFEGRSTWVETRSAVVDRWISISFYPFPDGVSAYWRDIGDRVLAEQALRASEEHMRFAQEAAGIGTWEWDLATNRIRWSPEMFRLLGIDPAGAADLYAAWLRVLHPEDREAADAGTRRHRSRPGLFSQDFRILRPDGEIRWINSRGKVIADRSTQPARMLGVNIDITERKRAEAALRDSEERLRLAIRAGRLGTWDIDLTRQIGRWSPDAAEMHGFPPGRTEMALAEWGRLIHPDDLALAQTAFTEALAHHSDYSAEYRIVRPDGTVCWTSVQGSILPDPEGRPTRVIGVVQDVTARRAAEEGLRESERRLLATYSHAPVGIAETDRQGRFLRTNEALGRITGYTPAELRRLRFTEMTHPEDVESDMALYRRQLAGELDTYSLEKRYIHRNGQVLWIALSSSLVRDESGQTLYAIRVTQDITERKQAEAALVEERRSLETLNRVGALLAAELDLERLVQAATDAATDLTGAQFGAFFYNLTDERGESYTLYTLSGVPREAFARFPMPRNTGVFGPTFRGERIIRSDDITRAPEYGHNAPYHGMPEGHLPVRSYLAVPVISRSGEVLGGLFFGHERTGVFNERAERLVTGIAGQAAIAIDNARLFRQAQSELEGRRRVEAALRDLNENLEQRVRERSAALEETARRLAQEAEERQKAEAALRQAQKMEAVGQLTGGVAHDFNNLLTVVLGSLDMIERRLSGEPGAEDIARARRSAGLAVQGARRAARLTQQLLAFSRRQALAPKVVDANRLVSGMSELLRRTLGEAVAIETVLGAGLWRTRADPNQLESAILNLAINARDAMPRGGRLTIETANAHLDDASVARLADAPSPGQYVLIAVTDTGLGMDQGTMERAFEPFFTTKDVGHGTGLGLSQVYGFVRQSGGHVRIYSEPGQGTTVKIYLPRLPDDVPAEEEAAPPVRAVAAGAGGTVLLVEDNPEVRAYSAEVLRDLGYRVLEAPNGPAALRVLDQDPSVRLLFTDVGLPEGMNGRALAEEARRRRPGLKVLFTTGYTQNAIVHNGMLDPGVQVLGKPFTGPELAAKIRLVLDEAD